MSKPGPMGGDIWIVSPPAMSQISPAVPSWRLTRSSNVVASASGGEAIAMNAGLPSSEVRSWQNCPGVAYPLAISLSTLSTMEWRPPSLDAGVLLTTEPAPQVKSFQPAVTMPCFDRREMMDRDRAPDGARSAVRAGATAAERDAARRRAAATGI